MSGVLTDWLDWSGRTGRGRYAAVVAVFFTYTVVSTVGLKLLENPAGPQAIATGLIGLLILPMAGYGVRRLHDIGQNGAWTILQLVPFIGLIVTAWLLFAPTKDGDYPRAPRALVKAGVLGLCLVAAFGVSRVAWTPYWIPSGSMKPALLTGDYVIARRSTAMPQRGDIIVFRHPTQPSAFISRVIGLPGDTVALQDGTVVLNGAPLPQQDAGTFTEPFAPQGRLGLMPRCIEPAPAPGDPCRKTRLTETLPGGRSYGVLDTGETPLDTAGPVTVPDGHLFVLGDNRDNAADSRVPQSANGLGFVPAGNALARPLFTLFSPSGNSLVKVWTWRAGRFFRAVQ